MGPPDAKFHFFNLREEKAPQEIVETIIDLLFYMFQDFKRTRFQNVII